MKSDIRTINHPVEKVEKKLLKVAVLMGYSNANLNNSQKLLQFETKKSLMSNSNGLKVQINYSDEDGLTELIISCDWLPTLGVKPLINISDKLFNKTIDDFVENLVKLIEGNSKISESTSAKQKTVSEEIRNASNAENKKNNTIMYVVVVGAILAFLYMAFVGF